MIVGVIFPRCLGVISYCHGFKGVYTNWLIFSLLLPWSGAISMTQPTASPCPDALRLGMARLMIVIFATYGFSKNSPDTAGKEHAGKGLDKLTIINLQLIIFNLHMYCFLNTNGILGDKETLPSFWMKIWGINATGWNRFAWLGRIKMWPYLLCHRILFFPNMLETNATNLENGFVTQRSISMNTKHMVTLS